MTDGSPVLLPFLLAVLAGMLPARSPQVGLAELPAPRSGKALQFSSWDRSGGNEDHSNWLRVLEDGTRVLAEVEGTGRINRIWSADPRGPLRIEMDGAAVYDGPFAGLFDQSTPPFLRPLAGRWGGGFVSYVPMPFREGMRIASPDGPGFYYQIGVELRDESERFAIPPGPLLRAEIDALLAGARTRDAGETVVARQVPVRAGTRLLHREGPGELIELRVRPAGIIGRFAGTEVSALWIEVRYDGEELPAIAAPLDELFECLPAQAGAEGVLRLPMPFHESIEIRAVDRRQINHARAYAKDPPPDDVPRLDVEATLRALPADHDRLYLHGRFHRQRNVWGEAFPVLHATGSGHFAGLVCKMVGAAGQGLSFLEGDETITVDGEVAFRGTGTEDWFDGAWYFRTGTFRAPFHALAELDPWKRRVHAARFHVADPIPFRKSFAFDLEHGGNNDTPGSDYAVMAWWYQDSPAGHDPDTGLACMHHMLAMAWDEKVNPTVPEPSPERLPAFRFWPGYSDWHENGGVRTVLPVGNHPIDRICVVTLFHDGRLVAGPVWSPDPRTATRGFTLEQPLEIDEVLIEPILPAIRSWRVVGPFPGGDRAGIDRAYGPEADASPDKTYADILGNGPAVWRNLPGPGAASGYVDLNPLFSPNDEVVAYAFTRVVSPTDQEGVLWLGSDDAVQVFWNGEMVHEHRGLRGAGRDQDRVPLRLQKGDNALLLKVEDYFGGWGFYARIEDAVGLEYRAR